MIHVWIVNFKCFYVSSKNEGQWNVFIISYSFIFIKQKSVQTAKRMCAIYEDGTIAENIVKGFLSSVMEILIWKTGNCQSKNLIENNHRDTLHISDGHCKAFENK